MDKFVANLKRQAEENPIAAMGVGAVVLQAVSKLINASAAHRNSAAWKKEVNRRTRNSKK